MAKIETPNLRGVRVLVVDDDADNCEVVAAVLELAGAHAVTAQSAADAIVAFEKETPHVLISDIGLPGENGFALLRRVRALPPSRGGAVPVIALSGYSQLEDPGHAHGFHSRLTKPLDLDRLLAAVAHAVNDK